jgi:hypothetical protein
VVAALVVHDPVEANFPVEILVLLEQPERLRLPAEDEQGDIPI